MAQAIAAEPDALPVRIAKVDIDMRAGRFDDAGAEAALIRKRWPDSSVGYAAEARVLAAKTQVTEAVQRLQAGITATGDGALLVQLHRLLVDQARGTEADAQAEKWFAAHPRDIRVMAAIGDTLLRELPNAEVIVVTTPQQASAEVAERAGTMASMMEQKVLGVVENMSWLETRCPHCDQPHRIELFGAGGGTLVAEALTDRVVYDVPLLAQIPFDEVLLAGGDRGTPIVETSGLVEQVRRTKDPTELDTIGRACRIVDRAWTDLLARGLLAVGRSEREVAADLEHAMRRAGSDGVAFETIIASGPNGAHPHHVPADRVLADGDLVVVDFGATVAGYASDCTRTVALGGAADRLLDAYEVVRRAQIAGVDAVRAGLSCAELDGVSRGIIAGAGFGDHFGHSLGHGVGLDVHEAPAVSQRSTSTLSDGDVITIEPGIYLPGLGGIRIEDTVAVTGGGGRSLTTTSTALRVL